MGDVTLDEVLPTVRDLAKRKAAAFVRRCRIPADQIEDVASDLTLKFIVRWPKYDSQRASVLTYASRSMDADLVSVVRCRMAQCRQWRELPVPDSGPSAETIHQFRLDLDRVLATMPEAFRATVSALALYSAVDAAELLGCSRQTIHIRKHQIRKAFIATGITSDYFARQ